ncbi:ribonuclease HII [Zhouia amylolytica]|uniref:ribonuclease HII n=1 Tax=Zhouia amylolytica TaxID=376730 RepID=UPI0020CF59C7|nr:ribonuclease HII [Zhouia amylolytica]MCQ0112521.1 ribonuclease HII [Zhouia amylolytica]
MKKSLFLLILSIILSCTAEKKTRNNLIDYIPNNVSAVLMTSDLQLFINDTKNNDFINAISGDLLPQDLEEKLGSLKHIHPKTQAFVGVSEIGTKNFEYTIITREHENIIKLDSTKNDSIKTISYEGTNISSTSIDEQPIYYATLNNNVFIGSSSQLIIENAIRNEGTQTLDTEFLKLYDISQGNSQAHIFINHTKGSHLISHLFRKDIFNDIKHFGDWTSFDATLNQSEVVFNGITVSSDSLSNTLNAIKNTKPISSSMPKIIPIENDYFSASTFSDYKQFNSNATPTYKSKRTDSLFNSVTEVATIGINNSKIVILNSVDSNDLFQNLQKYIDEKTTFREKNIYSLTSTSLINDYFHPLVKGFEATYAAEIDNFIAFGGSIKILENLISNYQNNAVIENDPAFKDLKSNLADASSLLWVGNLNKLNDSELIYSEDFKKQISKAQIKGYKYCALQFIAETDYAHFNAILKKKSTKAAVNMISQVYSTKLNAPVLTNPQFVINHRSKQKEVIVQDEQNNLYLISADGNVLWKKELDGKIQGSVDQVDLYRNGRLQLAFVTTHSFYIIDRNGNDVSPYPLHFNNPVTQPLAIFDYDGNKKYRFPIVQGNIITMYNREGKKVNGFVFNKTTSNISDLPKHFRFGKKDYLVFKEENGTLHILHRTGKPRIKVKEKIDFSSNNIFDYENSFSTTTKGGDLLQITQDGKIRRESLALSDGNLIDATSKTLVTLSENELTIKGKKVELDYGLYTAPKIFYIYDKIYVSVTDTQANKVYLFDSNAKLFPNFPIYGTSAIDLNDINNDRKIEITVKGEDDSILVYRIN